MTKPDDGAAYRPSRIAVLAHGYGCLGGRAEQTGRNTSSATDKSVYGGHGKQYKSQEARCHVDGHRAFRRIMVPSSATPLSVSGFLRIMGQYMPATKSMSSRRIGRMRRSVWSGDFDSPSNDDAYKPSEPFPRKTITISYGDVGGGTFRPALDR